MNTTARLLSIFSAIALIVAPVVMLIGAFEINFLLIGTALLSIGALGLYAGMRVMED